jgi:hypothetical protein
MPCGDLGGGVCINFMLYAQSIALTAASPGGPSSTPCYCPITGISGKDIKWHLVTLPRLLQY